MSFVHGAPALGSDATQAAARASGRVLAVRGLTVRGLAVRALAVAGFAAVAWLLGSSAAHADQGPSAVDGLAGTAQPVVSLVDAPVLQAADRFTGALLDPSGAALARTMTKPVTRTVAPVTRAVAPVVRAVTPVTKAVVRPVTQAVKRVVTQAGTAPVTAQRHGGHAGNAKGVATPAAGTDATQVHNGSQERIYPHHLGASGVGHMPWLEAAPGVIDPRTAGAGDFGTPFRPDSPLAPMQAHQGGAGTSAPGPGCHGDGGPNAVVGTSSAAGTADVRRLRAGSEGAAVRREPAAPTVSPD